MILSQKQHAAVALLSRGMSDREIAAELGVAYRTAKQHLEIARAKTGATNRVELAVMFVRGAIQAPAAEVA